MKKNISLCAVVLFLGFALITSLTATRVHAASGVNAAYGFAEGAGISSIDSSGNNNTATLQSTTWILGKFDNALSFNGSTNAVQVLNSTSVNITGNQATFSFWLNPTAITHDAVIIGKPWIAGSFNPPYYQYGVELSSNRKAVDFYFADASGNQHGAISSPNNSIKIGVWQYVTVTYDGTNVRFYIDGVLKNTVAQTGSFVARTTNIRFGVDGVGSQGYQGKLDEVRIYNRVLTFAEIQSDMQTAISNTSGPLDTVPPTGSITINGGAAATNSTTVTLGLSATDNSGAVTQMRFSNTGTSYSAAEAYTTTKAWTLTTGAGVKTVYVQFADASGNWSVATTATITLDTTAPTISGVTSSGIAANSTTITWTTNEPATSQVEYGLTTSYGTLTGLDVALVTSHSVTLSSLAPSTKYNYRVRSKDAAGNEKLGANVTFTTLAGADITAPSVPAGLSASPISVSQINLSWSASTDNVGVARYFVFRDGVQIATTTSVTYSDIGLSVASMHTYKVAAQDVGLNTSVQSMGVTSTTLTSSDVTAPLVSITDPANGANVSGLLSVTASASDPQGPVGDPVSGVAGVQFKIDGVNNGPLVVNAPYTISTDTTTLLNGSHTISAIAQDGAGNIATASLPVTVNNQVSADTYSTTFPLSENPISEGGNWVNGKAVGIDWNNVQTIPGKAYASVLSGTPNRYNDSIAHLTRAFSPDQYAQGTVYHEAGYQPAGSKHEVELLLRFQITPNNARGYEIMWGVTGYLSIVRWNGPLANYTTLYDSGDPGIGVPFDGDVLRAEISGDTIKVYKNGALVQAVSDATYATGEPGIGLWPVDAAIIDKYGWRTFTAGSLSTTPDVTPPTIPTNLAAIPVSSTQINLSWNSSTDDIAVAGYRVYRNGVMINTSPMALYSDTGLMASTSYAYNVTAYDVAGNISAQSSAVSATTQAAGSSPLSFSFGNFISNANDGVSSANELECGVFTAPLNGVLDSISHLQGQVGASWKGVLVDAGTNAIVTNGVGNTTPTANGWATSTFAASPSVIAGKSYALCFVFNQVVGGWRYTSSGTAKDLFDRTNSFASPSSPADGQLYDVTPTVYATYTTHD